MARILIISSLVANGHVGGSVTQFVAQRMGHEAWLLPSVFFSNHPGHGVAAGEEVAPDLLDKMLDALDANCRLGGVDAIFTGYLPSRAHVAFARQAIDRLRRLNKALLVCCDPIIGDEPQGLYIDAAAAAAIKAELMPRADLITPNRFELLWLAGAEGACSGNLHDLADLARSLGPQIVLVTSAEQSEYSIASLLIDPCSATKIDTALMAGAPHGTGDAMAAFFCGYYLIAKDACRAAHFAAFAIEDILKARQDRGALALIDTQDIWMKRLPDR